MGSIERLKELSGRYLKQYQEQRRLSPDEIQILSDTTIRVQADHIAKLEAEIARLDDKIKLLEYECKNRRVHQRRKRKTRASKKQPSQS